MTITGRVLSDVWGSTTEYYQTWVVAPALRLGTLPDTLGRFALAVPAQAGCIRLRLMLPLHDPAWLDLAIDTAAVLDVGTVVLEQTVVELRPQRRRRCTPADTTSPPTWPAAHGIFRGQVVGLDGRPARGVVVRVGESCSDGPVQSAAANSPGPADTTDRRGRYAVRFVVDYWSLLERRAGGPATFGCELQALADSLKVGVEAPYGDFAPFEEPAPVTTFDFVVALPLRMLYPD